MQNGETYQGIIGHSDWMTIIILVMVYLIWSIWRTAGGFLEQKSFEVLRGYKRKSLFAYDTLSEYRVGIILGIVHVLSLALYLYHLLAYFNVDGGIKFFAVLSIGIALYHGVKSLLVRYWNYIVDQNDKAVLWLKSYIVLNFVLGLALLPVIVLYTFGPVQLKDFALNSGIFFIVIYLIMLLARSFRIFFTNISSFIYLILYFCTLEILPLMIAVKAVL